MLKVLRTCLAVFVFLGGSLVVMLAAIFKPFQPKIALLFTKYVPRLTVKAFGIRLDVRRKEIMYQNFPSIYIANHQHALDLPIHASMVCLPTVAIGKQEIKHIPFFGWLFWLTGQILINRKHHKSAMATMAFAAKIVKKKHVSVWLFPEGTRSGRKPMQKFKKGAFYLAIQTQLPLLPIVASTYHKSINLNRWNAGKVIIEVLDPIPTVGKTIDDVDLLIEHSHKLMSEKIKQLDKELELEHTV